MSWSFPAAGAGSRERSVPVQRGADIARACRWQVGMVTPLDSPPPPSRQLSGSSAAAPLSEPRAGCVAHHQGPEGLLLLCLQISVTISAARSPLSLFSDTTTGARTVQRPYRAELDDMRLPVDAAGVSSGSLPRTGLPGGDCAGPEDRDAISPGGDKVDRKGLIYHYQ